KRPASKHLTTYHDTSPAMTSSIPPVYGRSTISTGPYGFRPSRRNGRPIGSGIGDGLHPGVGPGWTIGPGASRPRIMAGGPSSTTTGLGPRGTMLTDRFMRRHWWRSSARQGSG